MTYSVGQELSASVPEEPTCGTAVVTANEKVWQSQVTPFGVKWVRGEYVINFDAFSCSWLELIAMYGPVTIIYLPEN